MPVRPWIALALVVAVVVAYLAWSRVSSALQERRLIKTGTPITATVTGIGIASERRSARDSPVVVKLDYTLPDGRQVSADGELPPAPGEIVELKQTLPIRIDPNQPSYWTARTQPRSWISELAAIFLLIPLLLLAVVVVVVQRQRVLRVYRNGVVGLGTVTQVKQVALAPQSQQVRFSIDDLPDRRIVGCFWPTRLGKRAVGDRIEVIYLPKSPGRVVAAARYAQG